MKIKLNHVLNRTLAISESLSININTDLITSTRYTLAELKELYIQIDQKLVNTKSSTNSRIVYLFLAFLGDYPNLDQVAKWNTWILAEGISKTIDMLFDSDIFRNSLNSKNERRIELSLPETLYIEVSHTVDHPYNSGIQRVARQVAKSLTTQNFKVEFFKLTSGGQPRLLTIKERHRLLNFKSPSNDLINTSTGRLKWALGELFFSIPKRIPSFLKEDAFELLRFFYRLSQLFFYRIHHHFLVPWSKHFKFAEQALKSFDRLSYKVNRLLPKIKFRLNEHKNRDFNTETLPILLFQNSHLLIIELSAELPRIEFYLQLKTSLNNYLSILVYDLIPIIAPEYCIKSDPFINYARLFRIVDHACCISASVKKDVEAFSKLVLRENPNALTLTHLYLAGNFHSPNIGSRGRLNLSERPKIVCVGTFEPRKNQISVLRAATLLHKRKIDFELIFAGNPGWKNDAFFEEKEEVDPESRFIKTYFNLSDAELDDLYYSSRFTIFVSHLEGFGLPILESLERSRPVITTNSGSMAEIAKLIGGCVLVDPKDILEIANAMERLLIDEDHYQRILSQIQTLNSRSWDSYARDLYTLAMNEHK